MCAVGFCKSNAPNDSVLGWHPGSWAYHGIDGGLYIESGRPSIENDSDRYGKGDVIGCGLNMLTGEGYRTLNGKRLESGTCAS